MSRTALRRLLTHRLNLAEFEVLCADLDAALMTEAGRHILVRVDDLGGPTLGMEVLAHRLIARLHQHKRLDVLVDQLRRHRADLTEALNGLPAADPNEPDEEKPQESTPKPSRRVVTAGIVLTISVGLGVLIAWVPTTRIPFVIRLALLAVAGVGLMSGVALLLSDRWGPLSKRHRAGLAAVAAIAPIALMVWVADVAFTRPAVRVTHDWCPLPSSSACFVVRPPAATSVDLDLTLFVEDRQATKVTRWQPGLVGSRDGPPWTLRRDTEEDFSALVRDLRSPGRFEVEYDVAGTRRLLKTNVLVIVPDVRVLHADDVAGWRRWLFSAGGVLWLMGLGFLYSSASWLPRQLARRRRGTITPAPSWMP